MPTFKVRRFAIHVEKCIVTNADSEEDAQEKAYNNDDDVSVIETEFDEVFDDDPSTWYVEWVSDD